MADPLQLPADRRLAFGGPVRGYLPKQRFVTAVDIFHTITPLFVQNSRKFLYMVFRLEWGIG